MVPALGRMSKPSIDFPQLHWKKDVEPTDENLREWAETLRQAWPEGAHDGQGWLSNHALGILAEEARGPHDEVWNRQLP